jgi:hypothetical protein
MDVHTVLSQSRQAVLDETVHTLRTAHFVHYESWGDTVTRERIGDLLTHVMASLHDRDLAQIVAHCEKVAQERFNSGFDIVEVQTAFNTLEQTMWRVVVANAPSTDVAEWIGMLSAILGAGKDAVARTYVRLATHRHVPAIDIAALAEGTV